MKPRCTRAVDEEYIRRLVGRLNELLPDGHRLEFAAAQSMLGACRAVVESVRPDLLDTPDSQAMVARYAAWHLLDSLPSGLALWTAWKLCYGDCPMPPRVAEECPIDYGRWKMRHNLPAADRIQPHR